MNAPTILTFRSIAQADTYQTDRPTVPAPKSPAMRISGLRALMLSLHATALLASLGGVS